MATWTIQISRDQYPSLQVGDIAYFANTTSLGGFDKSDNLTKIGGQCSELYPEKPIFDIPSRPKITAQELIDQLMDAGRVDEARDVADKNQQMVDQLLEMPK